MNSQERAHLRRTLERFISTTNRRELLANDPLELVHAYEDPRDQEVVGLLVSMLAYGRVSSIRAKARQALEMLGPRPARALRRGAASKLENFVYRFQSGHDVPRFLRAVMSVQVAYGSLARAFLGVTKTSGSPGTDLRTDLRTNPVTGRWMDPCPHDVTNRHESSVSTVEIAREPTYVRAMAQFRGLLLEAIEGPLTPGLRFLLPTPESGAAKRLCLYLRWMIRGPDGVDLGTFRVLEVGFEPSRLIIPLDTHVHRIARYLGLTARKSADLATALEITNALRKLRPDDPLYYDLALCHLGISGSCPRQRNTTLCAGCPIQSVCTLGSAPQDWPFEARRTLLPSPTRRRRVTLKSV